MSTCSPVSTATPFDKLSAKDGQPFYDETLFQSIVGGLQYLTFTRPDIAFAVNKVSQFMHCPTDAHWSAVNRILHYVHATAHHGLFLSRQSNFLLHGYSDADWGGSIDDRKSTTGFAIYLGSNLISWVSRKQRFVSRSFTEAEYRAIATAFSEITWLRLLLHEIGLPISVHLLYGVII
ncbi:uncharacterized mitochondrial protein AtMg00810-like [Hevea brasiliensis]|uniref:uncharacterized mitochondrial protein AtMg00810-like n=1 Tax=Hevea brasiliensis TaxID=3981 RepID=UPI0026011A4E|nr:uncharacterized mitochondrial protein AtMg00810-like [Hevea brasiliensis]